MSSVTFLIGNGFDLAWGLHSRYSDSYDGYIGSDSGSEIVARFKKTIEKNIATWADFEMKLAEYAHMFTSESELVECIRDYSAYLNTYLENEQNAFFEKYSDEHYKLAIQEEMKRSVGYFFSGLTKNDDRSITSILADGHPMMCKFICFNYTRILDELVNDTFSSGNVETRLGISCVNRGIIHIHGRLHDDVVLGVDNESQLIDLPYTLSRRGKRNYIKPMFLEEYDNIRKKDTLSAIQSSNIICTYGWSLGDSDLTWRNALSKWLLDNQRHHLVIYKNTLSTKKYPVIGKNQKMDDEEDYKEVLVKKLFGESLNQTDFNQVFSQIHVPTGSNIFDKSRAKYTFVKGAEVPRPPASIT